MSVSEISILARRNIPHPLRLYPALEIGLVLLVARDPTVEFRHDRRPRRLAVVDRRVQAAKVGDLVRVHPFDPVPDVLLDLGLRHAFRLERLDAIGDGRRGVRFDLGLRLGRRRRDGFDPSTSRKVG